MLHGKQHHDSTPKDFLDLFDLVVFFAEDLKVVCSGGQGLHNAVGFKAFGSTQKFGSEKENKKSQSLNRDLGAKDGKHFI